MQTTSTFAYGLWTCNNCKRAHNAYFITCDSCGSENLTLGNGKNAK